MREWEEEAGEACGDLPLGADEQVAGSLSMVMRMGWLLWLLWSRRNMMGSRIYRGRTDFCARGWSVSGCLLWRKFLWRRG